MPYEKILDYIISEEIEGENTFVALDSIEFEYWKDVFYNEFILEEQAIAY